jgi:hypothetical protein
LSDPEVFTNPVDPSNINPAYQPQKKAISKSHYFMKPPSIPRDQMTMASSLVQDELQDIDLAFEDNLRRIER